MTTNETKIRANVVKVPQSQGATCWMLQTAEGWLNWRGGETLADGDNIARFIDSFDAYAFAEAHFISTLETEAVR